jgi:hypothetical protein
MEIEHAPVSPWTIDLARIDVGHGLF